MRTHRKVKRWIVLFYLFTMRDKESQFLDGAKSYRLTVPADASAK
jgi:hypothetical protein